MKLRIQHDTIYRYRRSVTLQAHRLVLVPRGTHELRVLTQSLKLAPEAKVEWAQDVFGNLIATATFAATTDELSISAGIMVEQCAPTWPVFSIAPGAHSYPFRYSDNEIADLGALLQPQRVDEEVRLDTWVRTFVRASPTDTLSLLIDLNAGVAAAATYRTRDEEGTQTPLATLSLASGSCRDLAALFIEAARRLGFGARAVSGYLYDPDTPCDAPGSTHAWAEVYLPLAGWIAFDPTHRRIGSANLIPVAVGRANDQIMPISGGYIGEADDRADMQVRVSVQAI
ncbi:Transglutaminase-like enzyme, putative cysteine protease [Sphingomonas guangdongensis]|uniref:Transglutaminase-like enzyme, putative cysteine protease n=1 Tax=Sphingomonas guangdongensis TaxID=1141890 RepID=A0A285QAL1_9SPHN|nr:transglutaminase family protein [Sphingomonas guangdongensis]SOB78866.1 Transglutaminase-like enzyme, putative cysteine protease [Sphingomonas guangdongensis]